MIVVAADGKTTVEVDGKTYNVGADGRPMIGDKPVCNSGLLGRIRDALVDGDEAVSLSDGD